MNEMSYKISIILPIYNEEENIPVVYNELKKVLSVIESEFNYEIIFVNGGSADLSWQRIHELAQKDNNIFALNFSRNFGHQLALTAGYDKTSGDIIVTMDADLQDPPALILEMIEHWKKGYAIMYARRIDRNDTPAKKISAYWYYHFLEKVSDVKIPRNVGDFRLIDKKVLHYLRQCREKSRYLRGMVAWSGFQYTYVDFERPNRVAGQTGYTWSKMFKLAFDGMTSFSLFPLRLAAYAGAFVVITGCLMFLLVTIDAFLYNTYYPLFKWLVIILYVFTGIQSLLLWFLGEYIGRIFEQQQGRPLYIVSETLNVE